jgi:hypothetical protein
VINWPGHPTVCRYNEPGLTIAEGKTMLFALFYVLAIAILVLHFTGFLARYNIEWIVLILAAAVFPAAIYL